MAETLDLRHAVMRCSECAARFGRGAMFCPFDGTKLAPVEWNAAGDPLLGKVIDGRYEVVGVLGEGGMGTVYKVRHTALDRLFAMKVLRRDIASDPDLAARFMREARATASVRHPNIVAINDFGRIDGDAPYFVMENLVGQTLAQVIKTGGAVPAKLGVRVALKIAAGVGAAHAEKIVHRDLKPDNVFVLGNAANPAEVDVRVVDFGAALVLGASRVTRAGVVFGTPHYMSPEQASGQRVDHRADVYALGIIMYEMFTGRVPFVADTYMGVLTQHMFAKPTAPSQVSAAARWLGPLEAIILRTLEKKPEHRYASMADLVADIEKVSSFGGDGALRVAAAGGSSALSRPVFALANALEPAARGEAETAAVTASLIRRRRARARAWVTYGAITLGVAAISIAAARLAQGHRPPAALAAPAVIPASPAASSQTAAPPAPSSAPPAVASPSSAPASSSAPPAPSSARAPAGRPAHPAGSASSKRAQTLPGDFADPWAR